MNPEDQPTILSVPPKGSQSSPPGSWQAPTVEQMQAMLPQYEIMDILGRGGMGAVYKGRQKSLKRLVAIKILPLNAADDEMKFAERFQNEAQTMAAMNHPAIVSVYDFGETPDGLLYFIMEFVDGTDVQKMVQTSGKLSGDYALAITAHVCDALSYAHKRGVIHRDIKPANILIDQEGHIKVADFGLAKMHDPAQTSGLTKTNMAMGTPDYVAPEVLSPGMVADHRADLYAVGVMLYQMLTGEVPRGMFKLPSQKVLGTDVRFDEIICKAMEQDREERYQSATEVRRALDVIATTPQAKDGGTGIVSASQIPLHDAKEKEADKSVRPIRPWLAIGGIVAVLGVAGFFFSSNPKPQVSPITDNSSAKTQPATPTDSKTIDLLPLVDVNRDMITGEWSRDGGDLLVKAAKPDANGTPRLQLPYQPPEEYDFEIEFTPESGTNMVGQVLSAYQHSFEWLLDAQLTAGRKAGFNEIQGVSLASRTDGTTMRAKFLTNGQRHRSTVEVRRNRVQALLDGESLVIWGRSPTSYERLDISTNEKLRDALHLGLVAYDRAVRFHKITVREITGTGKVDAPQAAASPANYPPGTEKIDWLKSAAWKEPWSLEGGRLKSTTYGKSRYFGVGRDVTVRMCFREATAPESKEPPLQLGFRGGPNGGAADRSFSYLLQIYPAQKQVQLLFMTKDTRANVDVPELLWKDQPFPPSALNNGDMDLELRMIGQDLSLWSGATQIAAIRDGRAQSGAWVLSGSPGVEITALETSGITPNPGTISPPQADDAPPQIANWQDVTASVREKARAIHGLVVEADGVRLPGGGPNAATPLMELEAATGDRAVRVRYLGQMQINLGSKSGTASVFVLAQREKTMFKRMTDKVATESLLPSVPHPAGFDANQPHELLLTVQGPVVRVRLDGRFVGDVQDDIFTNSATALVFIPSSTVQKVEVAEIVGK